MERMKISLVTFALLGLMASNALAALDDITVIALDPMRNKAVIKTADNKMHVLNAGDAIPNEQATLKQVLADKMVVEEFQESDPPLYQHVFVFKPSKAGEKSRIQRLDKKGPPKQVFSREVVKELKNDQ